MYKIFVVNEIYGAKSLKMLQKTFGELCLLKHTRPKNHATDSLLTILFDYHSIFHLEILSPPFT